MAKVFPYSDVLEATDKKTVIFSNYIDICENARVATLQTGYTPAMMYGDYLPRFNATVNEFKNNEKINPGIATFSSLGTGVQVTEANVVIVLDMPYRMYKYDQAIARVWRRGQDEQVYIYIPSLDTGEEKNINDRNIDIIKYFVAEVERITNQKSPLSLSGEVVTALERYLGVATTTRRVSHAIESYEDVLTDGIIAAYTNECITKKETSVDHAARYYGGWSLA